MPTSHPRFHREKPSFRLVRRLLVAGLALLPAAIAGGCKAMPYEGPGQWYIGKAEVTGDTKMFGAGGPTSIMFQLPQGTTNWIWRISTAGVTREWAVERRYQNMSHLPDEPEVWWMGDSTGTWSGTVKNGVSGGLPMLEIGDHAGAAPPFRAYTIDGVPANGDGRIEGKGQKVNDEIFVTMQWIKPDGSVAAQWKYNGLGQNEQEYLQSLQKMGAEPPKVVEPYPQRSP
ncbi:MAG: hypothetical protein ACKPEA_17865 [Planctomycetota bacterium]